jgi:hypothetical protein
MPLNKVYRSLCQFSQNSNVTDNFFAHNTCINDDYNQTNGLVTDNRL